MIKNCSNCLYNDYGICKIHLDEVNPNEKCPDYEENEEGD